MHCVSVRVSCNPLILLLGSQGWSKYNRLISTLLKRHRLDGWLGLKRDGGMAGDRYWTPLLVLWHGDKLSGMKTYLWACPKVGFLNSSGWVVLICSTWVGPELNLIGSYVLADTHYIKNRMNLPGELCPCAVAGKIESGWESPLWLLWKIVLAFINLCLKVSHMQDKNLNYQWVCMGSVIAKLSQ